MDSFMEDSVFDADDMSSDIAPEPVKAKPSAKSIKAPTKLKKPVAPKKKTTQTTLKAKPTPASKKRAKPASDDEDEDLVVDDTAHDDSLLSTTPPSNKKQKKAPAKKTTSQPLAERENDAPILVDNKSKVDSTDRYQKLTQLEHILKRPDTYIGSVERNEKHMWVYNIEKESMEWREVSFVPGLYKIFDEILVNAADNKQNDKNMDAIKVTVDKEKGEISVWNNGRGIPIEIHGKEKMFIPEMIFGHLLTSSNYNDDEQKVTGGRNGYGAKLCNVFSTKFVLETADSRSKKLYKQTWTNNMSKKGEAKITAQKGDDYTKITFYPDWEKFKMEGVDDDLEALIYRRVYDMAGVVKGVKVSLNGSRIKVKNFKEYMEMFTKAIKLERGEEAVHDKSDIITDSDGKGKDEGRWEIGFAVSDGSFQQVSFANSIATTSGGTHVNYVADQICNKLLDHFNKKHKGGAKLKPAQIRNHIFVFLNSQIVNPAFTSQTKEQLTTKPTQFGSKFVVSDEFIKKVVSKTDIITNILSFAQQKADQILKKSDGNKRSRMDNPKLTDANRAGTKDGWQCTLILTEGDSAKGLAMTGRSVVGPDFFGVFPLRGKLLNVRDASVEQVSKNVEIQNIKNILGLKHKQVYADCKSLRYGHIMIMTDQDHDGSHIKGLLINFLQVQYPSLLKIPKFLIEFITPIAKVYRGDPKKPTKSQTFFTMPEYETWKELHGHERGWEHKYYKGLGTSSDEDCEKYFRDLDRHLKEFHAMQDGEPELIELAFSKKKADERKEWLRQCRPGTYLDHSTKQITYTDFVNRELILFSMADNIRSIPSVVDGFKPGQRKVMFGSFKRNVKRDIKVVELAGYIMGMTAYHHGEGSLQQTIVGLAQTFVGSNNLNLLEPSGNFGSRLQGGSDSASARYIYTRLSPFARRVFHPLDEPLLKHNIDDDKIIEPEVYVPVVPMILINGADGIGTGWSSSIPNYNPKDIVDNLKAMMRGEEPTPMKPWWRDFAGEINPVEGTSDKFEITGNAQKVSNTEVEISELPIRVWTQDYKDRIVEILKAEKSPSWIKDYDDYNTKQKVRFVIRLEEKHMKAAEDEGLHKRFKLTKSLTTTNLVAFDGQGRITKYANVQEILKAFYDIRIKLYEKRKAYQLSEWEKDLDKLTNQARFIQEIIDGKLVVSKKKKKDLVVELQQREYTPYPKVVDATKDGELEPALEDETGDKDVDTTANAYDYLLGMAIWSLTKERVDKLLKQIGDKQADIDELIKLSREDLWTKDLDDFLDEWNTQLDDDKKLRKKLRDQTVRGSAKIKTQAKGTKKRKNYDSDDSDFALKKPRKTEVQGGIMAHLKPLPPPASEATVLSKPSSAYGTQSKAVVKAPKSKVEPLKSVAKDELSFDGASDSDAFLDIARDEIQSKRPSSTTINIPVKGTDDEERVVPATRGGRAAARKPVKYSLQSDSDDNSDGDFDVSKMVKGIGSNPTTAAVRPLFSANLSRPLSSAGLAARKSVSCEKSTEGEDADETDYAKLVPAPSASVRIAKTNTISIGGNDDEDDDMDLDMPAPIPAPAVKKRGRPAAATIKTSKATKPPATKKATAFKASGDEKQVTLSPAAKAYAAKQAKAAPIKASAKAKKHNNDESEVERTADQMISDDGEGEDVGGIVAPRPAASRPARRAATQTKKKFKMESESDEDADSDDGFVIDDDFE